VLDPDDLPGAAGVGHVGIRGRARVLADHDVAVVAGEVDVEAAGLGVVGRERHREQAALPAAAHVVADVEKGLAAQLAVHEHADPARLLGHEHARAVAGRGGDEGRLVEAADPRQADARLGRLGGLVALDLVATRGGQGRRDREQCEQEGEPPHRAQDGRRRLIFGEAWYVPSG
jgi:hypothetical protein